MKCHGKRHPDILQKQAELKIGNDEGGGQNFEAVNALYGCRFYIIGSTPPILDALTEEERVAKAEQF